MRVFAVIYIAIGILYHLISSLDFSWSDPWLYVHIGLWPFFVLFWIAIVFGICYVGYILYDKYKAYTSLTPEMKMKRKKIAERRKEVAEKVEKQRQEQAAEREKNSRPTNPTELH